MTRLRLFILGILLSGWGFAGCALQELNLIPTPGPLFVPDAQDLRTYEKLSRDADQLLSSCTANHSCDRAHYIRGLAALYENRKTAAAHFQASLAMGHSGTAAASEFWLHVLKQATPYSGKGPFAQSTALHARQLLDKEVIVRHLTKESKESPKEVHTASASGAAALKRELQARDKQVEDLTKQLEALKNIDLEMRERTLPGRVQKQPSRSSKKEND